MSSSLANRLSLQSADLEGRFAARLEKLRTEFEAQRAVSAAANLRLNRVALDAALAPLRLLHCAEVESESPIEPESRPVAETPSRSTRRRPSRSVSDKLEPGRIVNVKLNVKTSNTPRFREAFTLPPARLIPAYTSWSFVTSNQQQQKVRNQKRLFYTDDDTGETLPVSDDDEDLQQSSFFVWKGADVEWREFCLAHLEEEFGEAETFLQLLATHLKVDLKSVQERRREGKSRQTMPDTTTQLCRRCLRYNCALHPESNVLPALQSTPRSDAGDEPCGQTCWRNDPVDYSAGEATPMKSDAVSSGAPESDAAWDVEDVELLEKGLDIYGECACALQKFVFTKTCSQIRQYLARNPSIGLNRQSQLPRRRKVARKMSTNCRKGAPVVAKRLRHRETDLWHQYLSCGCKTNCERSCPCIKSNNFCDKYCACWNGHKSSKKNCDNGWKGCKCQQKCDTQRCPCVAAARECDPDLCPSCETEGVRCCRNMSIRTRKNKRVAMGLSEIIGWGTFMLENVKKDELIGEYTGELISDDEAERRGRVYDIEDKSYLFSATTETVIDANHRGNKLRFANHSSEPNCYVKYLLVDGDYRVGIFAGRDIRAGEELLYDYGSSFLSNWNEERTK